MLLRPCQTCIYGFLSVSEPDRYQNCASCRAQNREKDSSISFPSEDTPRNAKQKSAKALQKLEVQAKQAATRTELASSEGRTSQVVRKRASKRGPRVRPFTSETEMYGVLAKKVLDASNNRKFLEFHCAVHHFVHVLTINHQFRVEAITDELEDFTHLLFDRYVFSSLVGINSNEIVVAGRVARSQKLAIPGIP